MNNEPHRPIMRYFGGKWRLAPWIIAKMPDHETYVEPYGGAASVLMRKPRAKNEYFNDIDGEVVNVFKVLRDPVKSILLEKQIRLTPYARDEFKSCLVRCGDPVEQARRTIVKTFLAHRAGHCEKHPSFRAKCTSHSPTPEQWRKYPDEIAMFSTRLQGVVIESRPAAHVIKANDTPETLFFVDPPYVLEDRKSPTHGYNYEMTMDDHEELSQLLHNVQGMVMVSGYYRAYSKLYWDWHFFTKEVQTNGTGVATECLWVSPNCVRQPVLFD